MDDFYLHTPEERGEMFNSKVINHNYLAAVDMHLIKNSDEFIEICIFPLNNKFQVSRTITPFYAVIKPRVSPYNLQGTNFKEKFGVSETKYTKAFNVGIDRTSLMDLFEDWKENKFNIKEGKRISVVTHDWYRKKEYLIQWLGRLNFDSLFSFQVRDIQMMALYFNDWTSFNVEENQFDDLSPGIILSKLDIRDSSTDTLVRAAGIAEAYKKFINKIAGTRY